MRLRPSVVLGLVPALVGCHAAPAPVVSRIHTVSLHVKDFATFNSAFRLLGDDLGLPRKWGEEWTPASEETRKWAGFWGGNVCVEPCGPYETDRFDGDANAMFSTVTFLPHESARASASELDARGIRNGGPEVFLMVSDPLVTAPDAGVCIMDVGAEKRREDEARHGELRAELSARDGGPLGLLRVEEIQVRCPSDETFRQWQNLLHPMRAAETGLWRFRDGPALRLVKATATGIEAVVVKVRSLESATRYLGERGLLAGVDAGRARLATPGMSGFRILLEE